ncbi:ABC transporter substrate-binding protein [Hamadaea tsunoensis]|uniref:ABC transporter substrate-binding protein n=1 Tax=Hamadaea tsunoensis TaxID=53368 RepID=UPI0004176321|nr:ABC transporter substrate-binding protein [Hamadaea tsunoensis]
MSTVRRRALAAGAAALIAVALTGCSLSEGGSGSGGASPGGTVYFGVSAPVTGNLAEYGRLWKLGFELALDKINADGGIDGRPVGLKWEDSQSDPKQSVVVAQKFVADTSVIAELGDFSSNASIAASPTYTAAKLVQFGFTNSNPDFTAKGTDYQWSTSLTQDFFQDWNARTVKKYATTVSVVYQETDWGKSAFGFFAAAAKKYGLNIAYSSGFDPKGTDFRPTLIHARDAKPDAVVHIGYGPDGVLVANQLRDVGYTGRFFGGQNVPEFTSGAAKSADGDVISGAFVTEDPAAGVQSFVTAFRAKYPSEEPSDFIVYAYDALNTIVRAARSGGASREGVLKGFQQSTTFPSVQWGDFSFNPQTRRPNNPTLKALVLKDGKFVLDAND